MEMKVCKARSVVRGLSVVDGAGVRLNRIVGSRLIDHIDPFVLLDEFRSDDPDDYMAGFPWHPHRGIETVTYMIKGRFRHEDSKGGGGLLTPGTVQWMTAGRGILHSEMPEMSEGQLWGYQLWLTLPAKDKMVPPRYQHLSAEIMPLVEEEGASVKLISGTHGGVAGPAKTWFPISYFDVGLNESGVFRHTVRADESKFLYVHSGSVVVDPEGQSKGADRGDLVLLGEGMEVVVGAAEKGSGFLFLAGLPHNEPIVRGGPFVMNTAEEIRQAWLDYQNGRIFQ